MSTQQIRNIVNTQIDSLITQAKTDLRNEQTKKLSEIKQQVPTPQDISALLNIDINQNSCSARGNDKFS